MPAQRLLGVVTNRSPGLIKWLLACRRTGLPCMHGLGFQSGMFMVFQPRQGWEISRQNLRGKIPNFRNQHVSLWALCLKRAHRCMHACVGRSRSAVGRTVHMQQQGVAPKGSLAVAANKLTRSLFVDRTHDYGRLMGRCSKLIRQKSATLLPYHSVQ